MGIKYIIYYWKNGEKRVWAIVRGDKNLAECRAQICKAHNPTSRIRIVKKLDLF